MKRIASTVFLALFALPFFARADASSFGQPAAGDQPDGTLVGAAATLTGGVLTVTGSTAEGPATEWNHVFLGTEGPDTGYIHTSGKKGGEGMDYMIEGDFLYHWAGSSDRQEWNWEKVAQTRVTRTTGAKSFTVNIPVDQLHLRPGIKLQIFLVTSTKDYQSAVDTLPRDDSLWQMDVSAAGLNHSGGDADSSVSPPSSDARERFRKIASYACYYGKNDVEQLSQRDAAIVETRSQTPGNITAIKKKALSYLVILAPGKTTS